MGTAQAAGKRLLRYYGLKISLYSSKQICKYRNEPKTNQSVNKREIQETIAYNEALESRKEGKLTCKAMYLW